MYYYSQCCEAPPAGELSPGNLGTCSTCEENAVFFSDLDLIKMEINEIIQTVYDKINQARNNIEVYDAIVGFISAISEHVGNLIAKRIMF